MSGARPIEAVGTSTAAFVGLAPGGPVNSPVKTRRFADFERDFAGSSTTPLGCAVRQFFENGGSEAYVVRTADETPSVGSEADKTGIYALDTVDLFNILVLTDEVDVAAQTEAIAYCVRRRAFMIIDLPTTVTTASEAQAWMSSLPSGLRSSNAAFYFPRVLAPDPSQSGAVKVFPSAGAIAGLYARSDTERGVWKAPAGLNARILGVTGVSLPVNDNDIAMLNPMGLNCLRNFPASGTVCWGARTARGADNLGDEFKYVPVRRFALLLEESILRSTQWAGAEPNAEPLWGEIRASIGEFMHALFKRGAFSGIKPNEAYFVRCDGSTTAQDDIDNGRLNIEVGFAPLKPSEFVVIRIQQLAGGPL